MSRENGFEPMSIMTKFFNVPHSLLFARVHGVRVHGVRVRVHGVRVHMSLDSTGSRPWRFRGAV